MINLASVNKNCFKNITMTSFKLASVCFLLFYNILPVTSGAIVHSGTNEVNNNAGEKVWPSIFPILFPQNSITACLNDEDGNKNICNLHST